MKPETYIVTEFGSKTGREEACAIPIEENNESRLQSIMNRGDDEVRRRTMMLRNLPLNLNKEMIRKAMEKIGGDIVTNIKTRVKGPWLTASVIYTKEDTVLALKNKWYVLIGKDLCKMSPLDIFREKIENRNRYIVKLANLPFGITSYDLMKIVKRTRAKGCFIPRTNDRYDRLRYAIFNFETEEDMVNAIQNNDQYEIKRKHLSWLEMESKTYHKCGSSEYLVKDCSEIERQNDYMKRASRYSKVYERYKVPNYRCFNNFRERNNNFNRLNEEQTRKLNEQKNQQLEERHFDWEYDENAENNINDNEMNSKGKNKLDKGGAFSEKNRSEEHTSELQSQSNLV